LSACVSGSHRQTGIAFALYSSDNDDQIMPLWKQDYPGGNGGLTWCKNVTGIGSLYHDPSAYLPTPSLEDFASANHVLICPSRARLSSGGNLTANFQTNYDNSHYAYNAHLGWGSWPHTGNIDVGSVVCEKYQNFITNPRGMDVDEGDGPSRVFILCHNGTGEDFGEFSGRGFSVWGNGRNDGAPLGSNIAGYPHNEATPRLYLDGHVANWGTVLPRSWLLTDPGYPWRWPK